jgi:dihydroorotate dehydrogenase
VTPIAQKGNSKPRVFRVYEDEAIINRLGFNNKGVDYLVENLKKRKYKGIIGVNIGANKSSKGSERINDYLICLEKVHEYADYITINISSPNTPNLRDFHEKDHLNDLIVSVDNKVKEINSTIPIFLKISPDESDGVIDNIIELIEHSSFSGIIATNTTIDKNNIRNKKLREIQGGLSGKPLMEKSTSKVSYIKSKNKDLNIIGVGGVMNKQDYQAKINSGASLVQIYTGFIINGPEIVHNILQK